MSRNPNEIYESLELLLKHVNDVFVDAEVDLPERQYIIAGNEEEATHEAESVVVSFAQLQATDGNIGNPLQEPARCDAIWAVVAAVSIVRCVPTFSQERGQRGQAPSPEDMNAAAKIHIADASLLMDAGLKFGEVVWEFGPGVLADVAMGPISGGFSQTTLSILYGIV